MSRAPFEVLSNGGHLRCKPIINKQGVKKHTQPLPREGQAAARGMIRNTARLASRNPRDPCFLLTEGHWNRTTVGALLSVEKDPGTLARWKEYFTALLEGL